jgi:hypothetical protein
VALWAVAARSSIEERFFDCEAARPDRVGTKEKRAASPLRMTTFCLASTEKMWRQACASVAADEKRKRAASPLRMNV